jgi:hypothetical protein
MPHIGAAAPVPDSASQTAIAGAVTAARTGRSFLMFPRTVGFRAITLPALSPAGFLKESFQSVVQVGVAPDFPRKPFR